MLNNSNSRDPFYDEPCFWLTYLSAKGIQNSDTRNHRSATAYPLARSLVMLQTRVQIQLEAMIFSINNWNFIYLAAR